MFLLTLQTLVFSLNTPHLTSTPLTCPQLPSPHLTYFQHPSCVLNIPHLSSAPSPVFSTPHLSSAPLTCPQHPSPVLSTPHLSSAPSPDLSTPHLPFSPSIQHSYSRLFSIASLCLRPCLARGYLRSGSRA